MAECQITFLFMWFPPLQLQRIYLKGQNSLDLCGTGASNTHTWRKIFSSVSFSFLSYVQLSVTAAAPQADEFHQSPAHQLTGGFHGEAEWGLSSKSDLSQDMLDAASCAFRVMVTLLITYQFVVSIAFFYFLLLSICSRINKSISTSFSYTSPLSSLGYCISKHFLAVFSSTTLLCHPFSGILLSVATSTGER